MTPTLDESQSIEQTDSLSQDKPMAEPPPFKRRASISEERAKGGTALQLRAMLFLTAIFGSGIAIYSLLPGSARGIGMVILTVVMFVGLSKIRGR